LFLDPQYTEVGDREILFKKYSEDLTVKHNIDKSKIEIINQWLTYYDVLSELLRVFMKTVKIKYNERKFIRFIRDYSISQTDTVKVIKYYYTALASLANNSTSQPEHIKNMPLWLPLSRSVKNHILKRFGEKKRRLKFIAFAHELAYSRRCAPSVPDSFIKKEWVEYRKSLTQLPKPSLVDVNVIRDIIPIVFPNCHINLKSYLDNCNDCSSIRKSEVDISYQNKVNEGKMYHQRKVEDIDSISLPQSSSLGMFNKIPCPIFASSFINEGNLMGRAILLSEPLKTRSITTCSPYEYYAFKPIQHILKKSMSESQVLLFGRTAEVSDIELLKRRSLEFYGDQELFYVSGDYKNATGFISPETSKILDNEVFNVLGDLEIPLVDDPNSPISQAFVLLWNYLKDDVAAQKRNFYKLNVYYLCILKQRDTPMCKISQIRQDTFSGRLVNMTYDKIGGYMKKPKFIRQTNEQLMGDIKSFPLLCLLNYALWYDVNKELIRNELYQCETITGLTLKLRKLVPPCWINGDDFLAFAPLYIIEKWKEMTKKYDFVLSVGKTYISKDVAVINSTTFYDSGKKIIKIENKFLNLVFKSPRDKTLSSVSHQIKDDHLQMLFRKYNQSEINKQSRNGVINWFLPPDCGGLGLKGVVKDVTHTQRVVNLAIRKGFFPPLHLQNFTVAPNNPAKGYLVEQMFELGYYDILCFRNYKAGDFFTATKDENGKILKYDCCDNKLLTRDYNIYAECDHDFQKVYWKHGMNVLKSMVYVVEVSKIVKLYKYNYFVNKLEKEFVQNLYTRQPPQYSRLGNQKIMNNLAKRIHYSHKYDKCNSKCCHYDYDSSNRTYFFDNAAYKKLPDKKSLSGSLFTKDINTYSHSGMLSQTCSTDHFVAPELSGALSSYEDDLTSFNNDLMEEISDKYFPFNDFNFNFSVLDKPVHIFLPEELQILDNL